MIKKYILNLNCSNWEKIIPFIVLVVNCEKIVRELKSIIIYILVSSLNTMDALERDRTIFIANLSPEVKEFTLLSKFQVYGNVLSYNYLLQRLNDGKVIPRGYAYIEYDDASLAHKAAYIMNNYQLGDKRIIVAVCSKEDEQLLIKSKNMNLVKTMDKKQVDAMVVNGKINIIQDKISKLKNGKSC